VRRVPEHPPELSFVDLPRHLRAELEVEALVVDRPALVRLEVDAVVDVREQVVERSLTGLEVKVRHPHEWHPVPGFGPHRTALAGADARSSLTRVEQPGQKATLDNRAAGRRHSLVVEPERAEPAGSGRVGGHGHVLGAVPKRPEILGLEEAVPAYEAS